MINHIDAQINVYIVFGKINTMEYEKIYYDSLEKDNQEIFFALLNYYKDIIKYINNLIYQEVTKYGRVEKRFETFKYFIECYKMNNKEDMKDYNVNDTARVLKKYFNKRHIFFDVNFFGDKNVVIRWDEIL